MDPKNESRKHLQDMVVMALLLVAGLLFYFVFIPGQIRLSSAWGAHVNFTSRSFPNMLVIALALVSAVGLARAVAGYVRARKALAAAGRADENPESRATALQLAIPYVTYAIIVIYGLLFRHIGYVYATLLVPPVLMAVLGCRKWTLYLAAYAFGAVLYLVFKVFMNVPLP